MSLTILSSETNHRHATDIVLQRVQALESRVGLLESQVIRLQRDPLTPAAASLPCSTPSNQPAASAAISSNQETIATANKASRRWRRQRQRQRRAIRKAEARMRTKDAEVTGLEAVTRSITEQHMRRGTPALTPLQQAELALTRVNDARRSASISAQSPAPAPAPAPAPVPARTRAITRSQTASDRLHQSTRPRAENSTDPLVIESVNSTGNLLHDIDIAFKVYGKEGQAQAGQLQPYSPKDWQFRVRFHLDATGAPGISLTGWISKHGPVLAFSDQTGHETPFVTFRINFDLRDISEASLELGTVADPLLLPPDVSKQLEDPNEVPSSLRYLAFSWRQCQLVGFDCLHQTPVVSKDGTALLKALELLGSRPDNAVQMWFLCTDQKSMSAATIDRILRAVSRARDGMYKSVDTIEKTAETDLLDMAESCGN